MVWLLSLFNVKFAFSESLNAVAIGINIIAVILAALSLTLDLGSIDKGVRAGAPRFMNAYAAYGLMVTLIWLYLTLLRIIALLNRR